jgi:hypothetical protein
MPSYNARVELHEPTTFQDYVNLHAAMANIGFTRNIKSHTGATYKLPQAMYNGESASSDVATVRDIVKAAADSTGKSQ